ncbi:TIGR02453 family protein [Flavobacteriaceae bacterium R38]|nr:TIGR02453 family protein [Flavobacteriaceae bacterium R38]
MNTTISKSVLEFFEKLEENNNREWFNERKAEFKELEKATKSFFNELMEEMQKHDDIDRMKMFRIYRDVRFSKNKTPYKSHFAASFHRTKPRLRGGYYIQIKPGSSFIATGFWDPHKDDLLRIRKELEMDASEMREIIEEPGFKSVWTLVGDEVKSAPKGFSKDHEDIDLIKKKQYIFTKNFADKEVLAADFGERVNQAFQTIRPFFDYMSDVLTTDLNGVSLIDD